MTERLHPVVRLVEAAVVAEQHVLVVGRIEPDFVIVHVHALERHLLERLAAVLAPPDVRLRGPDRIGLVRIHEDLVVVARIPAVVVARPRPALPFVVRPVHARLLAFRGDQGVHALRVLRIHAETRTSHVHGGQTLRQLRPGIAAVRRLVEAALRAAADELPDLTAPLQRGGNDDLRLLRIHRHVGHAGVGVDRQDRLPRLPAVRRLVEAAVTAGRPERADCGHVDDVRVARVDDDVLGVLGVFEPHALPRLAGVGRLVHAVAVADAALVVVLAGAEPDDVRVARVHGDAPERIGAVGLEDRRPRVAAVLGLPQVARRGGDVPHARVLRVDVEVGHAARRDRGTDAAESEVFERIRVEPVGGALRGGDGDVERDRRGPDPDTVHESSEEPVLY